MNTDDFTPRRAIVTGSDSGIGAACAVALAEAGLDVGITWHTDEEGAQHTAEAVRARGGRAVVTRFDATDLETEGRVLDGLADELGGVDVFVNNAEGGRSEEHTSELQSLMRTSYAVFFLKKKTT